MDQDQAVSLAGTDQSCLVVTTSTCPALSLVDTSGHLLTRRDGFPTGLSHAWPTTDGGTAFLPSFLPEMLHQRRYRAPALVCDLFLICPTKLTLYRVTFGDNTFSLTVSLLSAFFLPSSVRLPICTDQLYQQLEQNRRLTHELKLALNED